MMKQLFRLSLLLIGMGGSIVTATAQQQGHETVAQTTVRPARVLGQAQTKEEFEAFVALKTAEGPRGKATSAENFLEKFPQSGLAPFAHQVSATAYHQLNDYDRFIHHAEKALLEVPYDPLLLTQLAVAYAQSDQTDEAMKKARRGLQTIGTLRKPPQVAREEWESQLRQFHADANYALGAAHLQNFSKSMQGPSDPNLKGARDYLERAVLQDPLHEAAHFQLGFAYVKQNKADKAILSYARAAALSGFTSLLARQHLEKIYKYLHPPKRDEDEKLYGQRISRGLEELIVREREYLRGEKRGQSSSSEK